jgi:hypothetical protein
VEVQSQKEGTACAVPESGKSTEEFLVGYRMATGWKNGKRREFKGKPKGDQRKTKGKPKETKMN